MVSPNPRSILIIDDDEISREVMQMTFELHGYAVDTAEDGDGALSLLGTTARHAVILMDTQMPGLSGVALVQALRAASSARIIAISASDPGEAVRTAADSFLLKPVQVESLAELLTLPHTGAPLTSGQQAFEAESAGGALPPLALPPLLDPIVFGKLKAMMPAASLREIYAATADDLKNRLAALEAAMAAENVPEVARIAHSIKGASAMVGLTIARDSAASLEISNLPATWTGNLAQLHFALRGLEGMLAENFSA